MLTIETRGLTHYFGKDKVLDEVNLQVPPNSIYGFLGQNGAGKTTTIKLLLGLLKKQSGDISLFGKKFSENRNEILQRTGSLVEVPSVYAQLTASENLDIYRILYRCEKKRIGEVLEIVGLSNTGKKKAGQFSLGMKQRLGIAISLLHEPELLILDEPTNGLDPNGIIEVRDLLRTINREKKITILISSHLLSEIEKLVTHTGIIHKGKMMFQGTLPELLSRRQQSAFAVIGTNDPAKAISLLREKNIAAALENNNILLQQNGQNELAEINRMLVSAGIGVFEISKQQHDLESVFMNITTNQQ